MRGIIWAAVVALGLLLSGSALLAGADEQDISAPVVVWLIVEPMFVDTSEASQAITITARITDDLSGFNMAEARYQPVAAPSQWVGAVLREGQRISGDARDGIYQDVIELPRYSAYGKWRLSWLYRLDVLNNYSQTYDEAGIVTAFYNGPPSFLPGAVWLPVVGR